jgi:hypothetical protein
LKLFIAIDLEGITGVVSERETGREGPAAKVAREHMRADLDAVLEGCFAAGADEVVVCDAHDDGRNLDATGLPPRVVLVAGSPTPFSMLQGIGRGYDGALFVGYHARAGTAAAVLEHTWNYKVFAAALGALEVGEFGLGALLAGHFGVPAVYAPSRRRRARVAGRRPAGAARLERRAPPAHLHARRVLRPRRRLPRCAARRWAHARDPRGRFRGGLPRLPHVRAAVRARGLSEAVAGARPVW